ncbi:MULTISPECIES: aldo/keto reductase [Legionella]|uniref:Aldo/keto reductase n=1 Tax=Legionella drozanskii LLAP-1 TaxID=1212489 RepID=A0A0W0SWQ4_9GAMM|nr:MULTISPECIES: aldo/keto reductase [Legionella]KTC87790.1 aldo/keto reductase [Legionella drozanskii LLAP-1]PJE11205.1 MAG: aldo/keto reductase [Legionella sp.]
METIQISHLKKASRVCLGTWAIGGWMWGGTEESEAIKTIHKAFELGINMVDTAPVYGFGRSEEIVGKAIKQKGHRENIILATKVGLDWTSGKITRNSSASRIKQEIKDSLKRLQTDYIDIYQIHWPDQSVSFEETANALNSLLEAGTIRAIGLSNFSINQMEEFLKFAPIHTIQPPYNLFEREAEEEILPFAEKSGLVTLAYGSLCRGLLSGKMTSDTQFRGDDLRKTDPKFQQPRFAEYLKAVAALDQFAQINYQKNVLALAIRWVLDKGHTIALWGARQPKQLDNVSEVMGWTLDDRAMKQIDKILNQDIQEPVGAEFMAPPKNE